MKNISQVNPLIIEALHQCSLFDGLNERLLNKLANICELIKIDAGSYLIKEGSSANNFYIIESGRVEITKFDLEHQVNHTIATLHPGQTVGEMSWLDNELRSASALAVTPTQVVSISFNKLQELAKKRKRYLFYLLEIF